MIMTYTLLCDVKLWSTTPNRNRLVCRGMAFVVVFLAPLATLHASPQQATSPERRQSTNGAARNELPAATQPPSATADPEEPGLGITILARDARTGRGLDEFRLVAGVPAGSVSQEFETRARRQVINWQPHTCRAGSDGRFVWPLEKAYTQMALRIEANGYEPRTLTGIRKALGAQEIVVELPEDKGITGQVLLPSGEPAEGAIVALALPHQEIVCQDGTLRGAGDPLPEKLSDRWRRPRIYRADAQGEFQLPTENEPAAILMIHASGVREMTYDEWKQTPTVVLQEWGSIRGRVHWHDRPGAQEKVTLTIHRDKYGYPGMVASYVETTTNDDGDFTFNRVLPGLVQLSLPIRPAGSEESANSAAILDGMYQHVTVNSGVPTPVLLGGWGRTVTGRFVGLDSWEGATFHFHPTAPHFGLTGDDVMWQAFHQLKQSEIGPLFFRDKQPITENGSFVIEQMLPGRYQLFLSAPGFRNYAASVTVLVDPELPGQQPAPLQLADIRIVGERGQTAKPIGESTDAP